MSGQFDFQELQKAANNLQKVKLFLDSRLSWWVEQEGRSPLTNLMTAAADLTGSLGSILQNNNIGFPSHFGNPETEQLPPDRVEPANLAKLAGFLEQMSLWFKARQDWQVQKGSGEVVKSMFTALKGLRTAAESVAKTPPPGGTVPTEPLVPRPAPAPAATPTPKRPAGPPLGNGSGSARLELDNNNDNPLVVSVRGFKELSPEGKELVGSFLEAAGFELTNHELRRFHDKVLRWLANTPEGQILVLRIGALRNEPYPSYQPRPAAANNNGACDAED